MRLLVDTHAFVWAAPLRTTSSSKVDEVLADPANEIFASAVSVYEIEYKRSRDTEGLHLVTIDHKVARYGVPILR